jgi:hypothetical protein
MKGFIKDMLKVLGFISVPTLLFIGMAYCESKQDPYEIGSHMDYTIICNDGFKFKRIHGSFVPCLNSDGTPLKCNQKRY